MTRAERKDESRARILDAAAARIRTEGLRGMVVADVMRDAGLTHGGFYAHFESKDQLTESSLEQAMKVNREQWTATQGREAWPFRLARLARRYLTVKHRDAPADGCALAALATEAGRADAGFREAYERELRLSLRSICRDAPMDGSRPGDAAAFMALCVGGIALSRAVADETLSRFILESCADRAERLASERNHA